MNQQRVQIFPRTYSEYFLLFFWVAVVARVISLNAIDNTTDVYTLEYWQALLRGLGSDTASAILAASVGFLCRRYTVAVFCIIVLWAYFHAANIDYIQSNQSFLPFNRAEEGLDKTFLLGSALSLSILSKVLGVLISAVLLSCMLRKWRLFKSIRIVWVLATCSALVIFLIPYQPKISAWQQFHMIEGNLTEVFYRSSHNDIFDKLPQSKKLADKYRHVDMSGSPRFEMRRSLKQPNVVILVVEALSSLHIDAGWLPYLKTMKENALYFPNFLTLNRMTINGTYTINCATYPPLATRQHYAIRHNNLKTIGILGMPRTANHKLVINIARSSLTKHPCLPWVLRSAGYTTSYLQGADIYHTSKNVLLPILGFQKSYGAEKLRKKFVSTGWGVDDGTLINYYGVNYIKKLKETKRPWMLYFMTLGTHHPYNMFPANFKPEESNRIKKTFLYVDQQIQQFMDTLKLEGLLDNTIVLITNDESGFPPRYSEPPGNLSTSKGLLIVHTPEGYSGQIDDLYTHADLYASLLDYLHLPIPDHLRMGRSIFRKYESFRPLVFSNSYQESLFAIPDPGKFVMCNSRNDMYCMTYNYDKPSFFDATFKEITHDDKDTIELMQGVKSVFEYPVDTRHPEAKKIATPKTQNAQKKQYRVQSFPMGDY